MIPDGVMHTNFTNIRSDMPLDAQALPLSLSNINIISSVYKYSDITNNNIDTCSICQQLFNDIDIIRMPHSCEHLFHLKCIDTWLSQHNTCPSCRHNFLDDLDNSSNAGVNASVNSSNSGVNASVNSSKSGVNASVSSSNAGVNSSNAGVNSSNAGVNSSNAGVNSSNAGVNSSNAGVNSSNASNTSNTNNARNTYNRHIPEMPNVRIFSNIAQGGNNNFRNDINNLITSGIPLINTIFSSNISAQTSSNNVNTLFNNINPLFVAVNDLFNDNSNT